MRIAGKKTKTGDVSERPSTAFGLNLKKSKRPESPVVLVKEKKVDKKQPWGFSSARSKQPVGLAVRREERPHGMDAEKSRSHSRPWLVDRSAVLNKRIEPSKAKVVDQGRPLWGVRSESKPTFGRSNSRTQIGNKEMQHTSRDPKRFAKPEANKTAKTPSGIVQEAEKSHQKNRYTFGPERSARLIDAGKERLTEKPKDDKLLEVHPNRVERSVSKTNLKSSLKQFPKYNRSFSNHGLNEAARGEATSKDADRDQEQFAHGFGAKTSIEHDQSDRAMSGFHFPRRDEEDEEEDNFAKNMAPESQAAIITDPEDVKAIKRLSNYSEENPNSSFYIEFNEVELKGKISEKFGGLKRIMTPNIRSKRLSRRKSSAAGEDEAENSKCKERRRGSSSGGSVYR